MGSDDLFKKKRAKLQKRKIEQRIPKPDSFLIVSEGTKTEPYYFEGFAKYINEKYGKRMDVKTNPIITTEGKGQCTLSLVNATAEMSDRSQMQYQQVWIVFDKDDFSDFDEAIALAKGMGFYVAWSNTSFE